MRSRPAALLLAPAALAALTACAGTQADDSTSLVGSR